jgi:hypothetical protein
MRPEAAGPHNLHFAEPHRGLPNSAFAARNQQGRFIDHDPLRVFLIGNVLDMGGHGRPPAHRRQRISRRTSPETTAGRGPSWCYHNVLLRHTEVFRGYHLFGLGAMGWRKTSATSSQRVWQTNGIPGVGFRRTVPPLHEGGNLLWD